MSLKFRPITADKQKQALKALRNRRNKKVEKIDNQSSPAGSSMYYYCHLCPELAEVRSEGDFSRVKHYCDECQKLVDAGWSEKEQRFIKYKIVRCTNCKGKGSISERRLSFGRSYTKTRGCSICDGEGKLKIKDE